MASTTPHLWLPSQPYNITAHCPVLIYTVNAYGVMKKPKSGKVQSYGQGYGGSALILRGNETLIEHWPTQSVLT